MIFTEERLNEILEAVKRDGKVLVKQLSAQFNVTEDMIRKDLQKLHAAGKVQRTYGGAIAVQKTSNESTPLSSRLVADLASKQAIANIAYGLLEDNTTIFLDVSSINYALARLIADAGRPLTVVTNMLGIAELFADNSTTELFFSGGRYHKSIGATIGAAAIAAAAEFSFETGFFGCCGIVAKNGGVYNFDPEEGRTKAAFLKATRHAWLVTETAKFSRDGTFRYAKITDFGGLICEKAPAPDISAMLDKKNISLLHS